MGKVRRILLCMTFLGAFLSVGVKQPFARERAAETTSNQYTQVDTVNREWEDYQEIPDTFKLTGENATYRLYFNEETLAFKVVDKRSGYIWHSNLDEKIEGDKLNKTWTAFAQSGISIDYLDEKAVSKRLSVSNTDTKVGVKPIDQGVEVSVTFDKVSITLTVIVQLEENGVSVMLPFESIKQADADYKLGKVYVYPFFGATRSDTVPGYMFIPDGPGALIRFNAETKAKNMYYGRYYGADLGMIGAVQYDSLLKRPLKVSLPVFGMVHGYKQNAFIAIVEKGAAYGEIQAHPAGVTTNFNFIYNTFIYNESYFQATNRSGAGVTTIQRETNAFDVVMHYRFLANDESDYVGMAKSFQQFLLKKGALNQIKDQDSNIGIRLEFLGAEKEKVLFWNRAIPMTTIRQMEEILDGLAIQNADVIYYGWQPHGASNMPPKSLKLDGSLGTLGQLKSLVEKIGAGGGNFLLYLDPQAAIRFEGGYSPRYDLAISITDVYMQDFNRGKLNFYFNLDSLTKRFSVYCDEVSSKLGAGLALDGIGSILYSDFKPNHLLNRENAVSRYQELLDDPICAKSFYMPNDYMFGFTNAYYDMPLTNSAYIYTTDMVPFTEIVLAGYVPYYGSALNFSSDLKDDLLRHVDYGVYPSYFLTNEVTAKVLNTRSDWIYTSSYQQWGEQVKQTYQWLNTLLSPVKGQEIIAREVLQNGVVATTYGNGKQIIVNYGDNPIAIDGLYLNGQDAIIREITP